MVAVYDCRLHVAAMRNKFDVVQLLIAYNANITAVDFQGRTALHCASRHGSSEVLEVLTQVSGKIEKDVKVSL